MTFDCKEDWLLALWGQPVTAVFWCEICSVYHVACIQMLCCITCMTRQAFTLWNKEWTSEAVDLRHHEFRLLGNQCILFMNKLDPLFDHIRRTAAFWKEKMVHIFSKKTGRCVFFGWGVVGVLNKLVRRNQIYLRHLTQHPCECLSTSPHANLHKDSKRL